MRRNLRDSKVKNEVHQAINRNRNKMETMIVKDNSRKAVDAYKWFKTPVTDYRDKRK